MSPPSYFDLGKEARDVFGKGYHWGQVKLDVKTRHPMSGTQLSSGGVTNTDSGKVTANIEVKTKRCPGTGTQLTTKWTTDNVLNTTVDVQVRPFGFAICVAQKTKFCTVWGNGLKICKRSI